MPKERFDPIFQYFHSARSIRGSERNQNHQTSLQLQNLLTFMPGLRNENEPREVKTPNDRRQSVETRCHQWRVLLVSDADCTRDHQHRTRDRPSEKHLIVCQLLVFVSSQQEAEVNSDGVDREPIDRKNVEVIGSVVEFADAESEEKTAKIVENSWKHSLKTVKNVSADASRE